MEKIPYILLGWLLGMLASLATRWSDRNQKINDFINGLYAQMLEIHPRLVANYISIKGHLEPLSQDIVAWVNSMLPSDHDFTVGEDIKKVNKLLMKHSKEEFEAASKILFQLDKSVLRGKGLKKFNLSFLENNLSSISLLNSSLQVRIWKILDRINLINQEIDRYFFYFEKTFEPEVMRLNERTLDVNMNSSLEMISDSIHKISYVVLDLLNNLKAHRNRWTYKNILSRFK